MTENKKKYNSLPIGVLVLLILLPIVTGLICICIGRMFISPDEVLKILISNFTEITDFSKQNKIVIMNIRLPRALLSMLVGAALSVSGLMFQNLFNNPLATPDTLGVATGASFGAVFAILFSFNSYFIQISAFSFGIIAILLTFLSSATKSQNANMTNLTAVILSGIIISALFNALISLVKYVADVDNQLPTITYWLMGSFSGATYKSLSIAFPIFLIVLLVLFLLRFRLNVLALPNDEAISLGVNIKMLRIITIVCATILTSMSVSMSGQVGWIGLIVPHMCKLKYQNNLMKLLPITISVGATFTIIIDTLARSLTASELPISILTAIVGAPFFIYLMKKRRYNLWK